jgi:hypothetical protein
MWCWSSTPPPSPRRGRSRWAYKGSGAAGSANLPKEWAHDRERRQKAGVPKAVRFRTRHELALEMLDERGPSLPHAWVVGDDERGRCSWFRAELRWRGECYLLAVPEDASVRDLAAADPVSTGRGPRRRTPFTRVDRWCVALAEEAWQTIEVRDGEKGPLTVQAVWGLVQARTEGRPSDVAETLVASARAARRRQLEARLPALQRAADDFPERLRPGV